MDMLNLGMAEIGYKKTDINIFRGYLLYNAIQFICRCAGF